MTGLSGQTIVYFGPEPWEGLWRNRHQLMSRLARDNDVWYIEPPALIRDVLTLRGRWRTRLLSRDESGVRIFHGPWWLPLTGREPFKKMSIRLYIRVLCLVARIRSRQKPVVWFSRPDMIDFLGEMPAALTVYHVVDEYSGYGHPSKTAADEPGAKERAMLAGVDVVIVVTDTLYERKAPYNANTHVVRNAVDFDAYARGDLAIPDDIASIEPPIIGYSGLVAARLDLAMLDAAAEARPDWHFVFVGTVDEQFCEPDIRKLRTRPNVHFLGTKPVGEVPRYVRKFDVCIIPYVVNLRAQHAGPLKLYEYAAAGKPIVTSRFGAALSFEGTLRFAGNPAELVTECEAALQTGEDVPGLARNRDIAAANTWDDRVRQLQELLGRRLLDLA